MENNQTDLLYKLQYMCNESDRIYTNLFVQQITRNHLKLMMIPRYDSRPSDIPIFVEGSHFCLQCHSQLFPSLQIVISNSSTSVKNCSEIV